VLEHLGYHDRYPWQLAGVWLRAEDVRDVFVVRTHLLSRRALSRLVTQRQAGGHRLWLIAHQATLGRAQRRALDLDPGGWRSMTLAAFGDRWSAASRWAAAGPPARVRSTTTATGHADADGAGDGAGGFPAVPGADFPVFPPPAGGCWPTATRSPPTL
jgi:hypothetical protein